MEASMKKLVGITLALFSFSAAADFVHPMDFDGSDAQKAEVIQFIKDTVRHDYCEKIDMCNDSTLRMMEQENLNAFKKATKATDRKIMDRVIQDYCNGMVDMCSYANIMMMYEENAKASKQELSW
ncbi:hypothetical protein VPPG_00022 [Vibrio phage VD1]|nr:hypothetical protein VPPG_00022 [Vibrio phage VD1]